MEDDRRTVTVIRADLVRAKDHWKEVCHVSSIVSML